MKNHELKIDIRYFDDVKYGKKNFDIRNNDRDFKVGDILELKRFDGSGYVADVGVLGNPYMPVDKEQADTIKVRIKWMSRHLDDYNKLLEDAGLSFSIESVGLTLAIESVVNEYFHTNKLPDSYVVLGIEVIE